MHFFKNYNSMLASWKRSLYLPSLSRSSTMSSGGFVAGWRLPADEGFGERGDSEVTCSPSSERAADATRDFVGSNSTNANRVNFGMASPVAFTVARKKPKII